MRIVNRQILIPEVYRVLAVQGDKNTVSIDFELEKLQGKFDISAFSFVMVTVSSGGRAEKSLIKTLSEDLIHLVWNPTIEQLAYFGRMSIQILAFDGDTEIWQTLETKVGIAKAIDGTPVIPAEPSFYTELIIRAETAAQLAVTSVIDISNQVAIATQQAIISNEKSIVSTQQAIVSTEQAIVSTDKANISTQQVIIATDKANLSTIEADRAKDEADKAYKAVEKLGYKGWFATLELLKEQFPVGSNGWWSIIGSVGEETKESIWVWDSDNGEWNDIQRTAPIQDYNVTINKPMINNIVLDSGNNTLEKLSISSIKRLLDEIETHNTSSLSHIDQFNNKANTNSPSFTGVPIVPTADENDNSAQIANTLFVTRAITNIDKLTKMFVPSLPDVKDALSNVIYMVEKIDTKVGDYRDEWILDTTATPSKFEFLGTTKVDFNDMPKDVVRSGSEIEIVPPVLQDSDLFDGQLPSYYTNKVEMATEITNLKAYADTKIVVIDVKVAQLCNPNLLINGDFQVWQRGLEFNEAAWEYTSDRWLGDQWCSVKKNEDGLSIKKSVTKGYSSIIQYLERTIVNKQIVLSAKIGNEIIKTIGNSSTSVLVANTADNNIFIKYYSNLFGRGNAVEISTLSETYRTVEWVKLELGSIATPFVPRSYGEELSACQRYYSKYLTDGSIYGQWADGNSKYNWNISTNRTFMSSMRVTPNIKIIGNFTIAGLGNTWNENNVLSKNATQNELVNIHLKEMALHDPVVNNSAMSINFVADAEVY